MARAELSLQTSARSGQAVTFTNATVDGHAWDNTKEDVLILVKNDSAGAVAVSFDTPNTWDGLAIPDQGGSVAAGTIEVFGPFGKDMYNQDDSAGDTGLPEAVFIDTDTQTSVSYAAVRIGNLSP